MLGESALLRKLVVFIVLSVTGGVEWLQLIFLSHIAFGVLF
jgi:hypothetical protein